MKTRDWGLLLLLSLMWGGSFYFYKVLDDAGLPALTLVLGRVGIAAIALLPVVWLRRLSLPQRLVDWTPYIFIALTNNVIPYLVFASCETQISSGLASIISATTPIFTAIIAHVRTKDERFSVNSIIGIALGFVGIVVLVGPDVVHGFNLASVAQLACFIAPICYGFALVNGRSFRGTSPIVVSTCQLIVSSVIVLPFELIVDKPWMLPMPSAATWAAMLGMAVLATSAAYIVYFALINYAGAVSASLVTLIVPVVALFLGGLFLHEHLGWGMVAGMALILIGLIALDGRLTKAVRHSRLLESINVS
ncbi:MAG: DMT family transporter [Vulcanimicrobiaceae bacterium]